MKTKKRPGSNLRSFVNRPLYFAHPAIYFLKYLKYNEITTKGFEEED